MIMATMVEVPLRMLTKRPTGARTSESGIWLVASIPTRANEPRTEITRPRDVTAIEPGVFQIDRATTMACVAGEIVKPSDAAVCKIHRIIARDRRLRAASGMDYLQPPVNSACVRAGLTSSLPNREAGFVGWVER